eukprot:TRINITY_DN100022_c0_g1_i1.p1 TRINITY_DN100022_c0_g1~~TRINITY_DN100022_c0_g1_i1.p1  ORF type:complete len:241 (+),score=39.15 TRINITY_DN100022_c0_g1_i1:77-724(+)
MADGSLMVTVTVVKLSGEVAFGPEQFPRSSTFGELCQKFDAERPKRLSFDREILDAATTLETLPDGAVIAVTYLSIVESDVSGAWFGHGTYIPKREDSELGREVFHVDGVCWFDCKSETTAPCGPCRIGFRMKKLEDFSFSSDVVIKVNGQEINRLDLDQHLGPEDEWTVVNVGTWDGKDSSGAIRVSMAGADCERRGQGGKYGLLIDRLVVEAA